MGKKTPIPKPLFKWLIGTICYFNLKPINLKNRVGAFRFPRQILLGIFYHSEKRSGFFFFYLNPASQQIELAYYVTQALGFICHRSWNLDNMTAIANSSHRVSASWCLLYIIPVPSNLDLLIPSFSSSLQYSILSTGSKSTATPCFIPETGTTTSVKSGVSNEIIKISCFLATNRNLTGPVKWRIRD